MKGILDHRVVLENLNSLTKFPSIPTLHQMGERGVLSDETAAGFRQLLAAPELLVATEKVDGTNCRVLCFCDGTFLVGSREELLWYSEDLIFNPVLHVVEEVRRYREEIESFILNDAPDGLVVLYLEVYGHGIGKNGREYSRTEDFRSLRLFDVAFWQGKSWWKIVSDGETTTEQLALRRDRGAQPFLSWDTVRAMAEQLQISSVDERELPPEGLAMSEVFDWVRFQPKSTAVIDDAPGRPEGVVLRLRAGNSIPPFATPVLRAKARTEDYARTIRGRG